MNVQEIIKLAKYETNTSTETVGNYDADVVLPQLNMVYKKIWRKIANGVNQYFRQRWKVNLNQGQNEYTLDGSNNQAMWKIFSVEIKNGNSFEKIPAINEADRLNGKHGYMHKDNSIFIYPVPKESIDLGLKVNGIQSIVNLNLEDEEDKIFPGHPQLRDIHEILVSGLKIKFREGKEDFDRANRERTIFNELLQDIIADLLNRNPSVEYSSLEY